MISIAAAIGFVGITVQGVLDLTGGHSTSGVFLLVCAAVGVPSFVRWRRMFSGPSNPSA